MSIIRQGISLFALENIHAEGSDKPSSATRYFVMSIHSSGLMLIAQETRALLTYGFDHRS